MNPNHNLFLKLGEQLLVPNLKTRSSQPRHELRYPNLQSSLGLLQYQPFNLLMWALLLFTKKKQKEKRDHYIVRSNTDKAHLV